MSNITEISTLPTELLEEIFSHLDTPRLLNCLCQNRKFFSLVVPLIWENLGDRYWGAGPKTPLRWSLITKILLFSGKTFVDYAILIQKIDLSCNHSPDFRVPKQTLCHLLINGRRLKEINFQYHKESSMFDEPFECLKEINPSIQISTPPTTPPPSFSSDSITYDDLRLLVKNNQKLNHMELYTIEGARVLNKKELVSYMSDGELPKPEERWTPEPI